MTVVTLADNTTQKKVTIRKKEDKMQHQKSILYAKE